MRKAFKAMNQQVWGVVLKQDTVLDVCIGGTINGDLHTFDLSDVPEICSHITQSLMLANTIPSTSYSFSVTCDIHS